MTMVPWPMFPLVCMFLLTLLTAGSASKAPSVCEENDQCDCFGTVYYGRKYTDSSGRKVTTIEELTKHKYLKREVNGPSVCSKESFRADPAVGHDKQCLCSLAEEPYPALCAPVNSGGVRVAIGFYGYTQNLKITLPTFHKHIFDVLRKHNIAFDVFSSTVQTSMSLLSNDERVESDEYSMRLMHPCAITLTPIDNIVGLDDEIAPIDRTNRVLKYTRLDLRAMIGAYSEVKQVKYDAVLVLRPDAAITVDLDLPAYLAAEKLSSSHLYIPSIFDSTDRAAFGSPTLISSYLCSLGEVRGDLYLRKKSSVESSECANDKNVATLPVKKSAMHVSGVKHGRPLPNYTAGPISELVGPRLCNRGGGKGMANEKVPRVAVGFFGMSRNVRLTLPSIQRHVFDVLDRHNIMYDVFWSTVTAPMINNARSNESNIKIDEYDVRLMRPCVSNLMPMYKVLKESVFDYGQISPFYHYKGTNTIRNIFCSLHTQKVLDNSIRAYSRNHAIKYDAVLALRPDVAVVRDIDLAEILVSETFSDKHIYIPDFAHFLGVNDRSAYGSPRVMSAYFNREKAFKISLSTNKVQAIYNTETFLKKYLKNNKIPVRKSKIRLMRVRADGQVPFHDTTTKAMSMPKHAIEKCQMVITSNWTTMAKLTVFDSTFC